MAISADGLWLAIRPNVPLLLKNSPCACRRVGRVFSRIRALFALLGALVAGFHGWVHLAVENAALPQQLAVFKQKRPRPSLSASDRLFCVLLHRVWPNWRNALVIVQADTVVR